MGHHDEFMASWDRKRKIMACRVAQMAAQNEEGGRYLSKIANDFAPQWRTKLFLSCPRLIDFFGAGGCTALHVAGIPCQ